MRPIGKINQQDAKYYSIIYSNFFLRLQPPASPKISQAAAVGGLNVEHLLNALREKVGQTEINEIDDSGTKYVTECPGWFKHDSVTTTIDIREMLNRGKQAVHEVLTAVTKLDDNGIFEIIAPFIPAPFLDKSLILGYRHWLKKSGEGEFRVFFMK